ncbi:MAG: nitroreductase family protein [Dehalococcoidia bacterium]|nr:nitroreductase family protein [Dehalococcoidia bacterium]
MNTLEAIAARRNVRAYTDEPIPAEVLRAVLDTARRAPSAGNRQEWDMVVVTDRAQLQALAGVWRGAGHVAGSAATVALIAPKHDDPMRNRSLEFDLGQLAMTLILAATEHGIGCGHTAVSEQDLARELLGFPDDRFCAWLVAMGYPADRPIRPLKRHNRRPFEEVVHFGTW